LQSREVQVVNETLDRIIRIIVGHLGVPAGTVTPAASFADDLDADSLDKVELIIAFEEEFQTEIPEGAAENITTVQDAIDFVEARKSAPSA
jgi:acyl carrier protein